MFKFAKVSVIAFGLMFGAVTSCASVPSQSYVFLSYYDQLTKYQGKPGNYFVRDAAGTTTGQHGDPTVNKGWAIYIWNTQGKTNGTGKWTKIAEEEQLDATVNEILLSQYATKSHVQDLINAIYEELYKKADKTETTRLNSLIGTLDRRVGNTETNVVIAQNDIGRVEVKTDTAAQEIEAIKEQLRNITGDGLVDISNRVSQLVISVNTLNQHLNNIEDLLRNIDIGDKDDSTLNKVYDALNGIKTSIGPRPESTSD